MKETAAPHLRGRVFCPHARDKAKKFSTKQAKKRGTSPLLLRLTR